LSQQNVSVGNYFASFWGNPSEEIGASVQTKLGYLRGPTEYIGGLRHVYTKVRGQDMNLEAVSVYSP